MEAERDVDAEVDPDERAFAFPPGGGATIPFAKDSEEARAIQAVIEEADRERAAASGRVEAERDVNAEVDPNESPSLFRRAAARLSRSRRTARKRARSRR
jgi:hypothetical protein